MSLATSTWLAEIDGLAKRQYTKNTIEVLVNQEAETYGKLTNKVEFGGDSDYLPVEVAQNEGGQGNISEDGALPTAGKPDVKQIHPTPRVFTHHNKFTGLSLGMLSGNPKSFASNFTHAMDSGIKTAAKELNCHMFRDGNNVLGYTTAGGTTTIACSSGIWSHFRPGIIVSIGTTAGTEVTTGTITDVTPPTTVNGTFSVVLTSGTVSAASSYMWRKSEYGIAFQGLPSIVATTGTYLGLVKDTYVAWKGVGLAAGTNNLSDAILHQAKGKLKFRGTKPNIILSNDTQFRMYMADTLPQVRFDEKNRDSASVTNPMWNKMEWIVDTDCGMDEVYMFDKSKLMLFENKPLKYDNSSGSILKYVPGYDMFSCYAVTYAAVGTQNCGAFVRINGLNVPIV